MVLQFDESTHTYRLDGQVVPSVTQLLKPIGPDFSQIPADVLERKRQLGTAVHLACELDDDGDLDDDSLDPALVPYVAAWRKFKADTGAVVLVNEKQLAHEDLRYAGTVDRVVSVGREPWLVDLKTSADPHAAYGVQLAGYEELLRKASRMQVDTRATVHLRDDGTFRLHQFTNPNDAACFRALLSIHHWKETTK